MNTKDWIVTEAVSKQLQKEKDAAFIWGYVCASFITTGAVWIFHLWGIV